MEVTLKEIHNSVQPLSEIVKKDMTPSTAFLFLALVEEVNGELKHLKPSMEKCNTQEELDSLLALTREIKTQIPKSHITFTVSPAILAGIKPFLDSEA
jgi:dihydroorotase